MSATILWLDHAHAKLFKLLGNKIEINQFKRTEIRHHTANEEHSHKDFSKFYHDVANQLSESSEILLIGPGTAKTQFQHYIEDKNPHLKEKVVGVMTVDHPTDNEILALSRKFFKKYDLFNEPIK